MRKLKPLVWLGALLLVMSMFAIVACQPATGGGEVKEEKAPVVVPEPNENGVVTADMWKDIYPDIYASYKLNSNNSDNPSYLEQYPFMVTIYDGMGFAKDYNEARSHLYTLEDLAATARPHPSGNCITCKTPELSAMVNAGWKGAEGKGAYGSPYEEVIANITEPVSCYNCHENNADGVISYPAQYVKDALGADASQMNEVIQACGQCHNEYFFDPGNGGAVTLPWTGLDKMNPDDMLAFYNEPNFDKGEGLEPFWDFKNSISGTKMIKVQHPEMETILGKGTKLPQMTGIENCSDCHMGKTTNDAGEEYTSHLWQSPLSNTELLETCDACHDTKVKVDAIHEDTHDRLVSIGGKLENLHKKVGEAAANGKDEAELTELRKVIRDSQFYFDFVQVENSYGAHNTTLTKNLLDKAEGMIDGGLAKL